MRAWVPQLMAIVKQIFNGFSDFLKLYNTPNHQRGMEHELVCRNCSHSFAPGLYPLGCPKCRAKGISSGLEVSYDPGSVDQTLLPFEEESTENNMWRYRELLPLIPDNPVTLGEGMTPLLELISLTRELKANILLKNETVNPTWSYKDRLNSLLISNAVALGKSRIATSSTGNHGASTAAYARRAGIDDVIVLLPPAAERPLRLQLRAYGAEAVVTESTARGDLLSKLIDDGWYPTVNVTDTHTGLPYAYEGYKTIAFELVDQLDSTPDAVVLAVGAGDGLFGIWKGFRELRQLGIIRTPPKMIAVQPEERAPLVEAIDNGSDKVEIREDTTPLTTSTMSLAVGSHAIEAIRESEGFAYSIDHDSVMGAVHDAGDEAIFLEPASSLTLAGVRNAIAHGDVDSGDTVVCIGTGAGVKWPDSAETVFGTVPEIEPTYAALAEAVKIPLHSPSTN